MIGDTTGGRWIISHFAGGEWTVDGGLIGDVALLVIKLLKLPISISLTENIDYCAGSV